MEIQELVNLILNSGTAIIVVAYFMFRDYKFMGQLQTTLTSLVETVGTLRDCVNELNERVSVH